MKRFKFRKAKGGIFVVMFFSIIFVIQHSEKSLDSYVRENISRQLSKDLGGGKCEWTPPIFDVPEDIEFYKTIIVGYPSGDKRLTFVQMEALTGLAARDEWDFKFLGMTNQPFIKANYPHHEGIWGWEGVGDQVIMVVRNMRRSMTEYHDILWDIGYAKTFEDAFERISNLYAERPPLEDFLVWRDERVMDEIHWYGWFIDYWMEAGLMRDMFTKKITTPEHWNMLMRPEGYTKAELAYDLVVGNDTEVTPSYDPHCMNDVSDGCHPIKIISAEKLVELSTGPDEGRKIADVIKNKPGVEDYMISEEAWGCIWTELIVNKKGLKTFIDRGGVTEQEYNFGEEMLEEMVKELDRVITKYSDQEWSWRDTAQYLVSLLKEHRTLIQTELDEVRSGQRALGDFALLGPQTREKKLMSKSKTSNSTANDFKTKFDRFNFRQAEDNIRDVRRERMVRAARQMRQVSRREKVQDSKKTT